MAIDAEHMSRLLKMAGHRATRVSSPANYDSRSRRLVAAQTTAYLYPHMCSMWHALHTSANGGFMSQVNGFVTGYGSPHWKASHPPAKATAPVVKVSLCSILTTRRQAVNGPRLQRRWMHQEGLTEHSNIAAPLVRSCMCIKKHQSSAAGCACTEDPTSLLSCIAGAAGGGGVVAGHDAAGRDGVLAGRGQRALRRP